MRPDPWYPLRYELARSRRYERVFVLASGRLARTRRTGTRNVRSAVHAYRRMVRDTDAVWMHGDRLYVLLAETSAERGDLIIERLRAAGVAPGIGEIRTAAFPSDGLTSTALVAAVTGGDERPITVPATVTELPADADEYLAADGPAQRSTS